MPNSCPDLKLKEEHLLGMFETNNMHVLGQTSSKSYINTNVYSHVAKGWNSRLKTENKGALFTSFQTPQPQNSAARPLISKPLSRRGGAVRGLLLTQSRGRRAPLGYGRMGSPQPEDGWCVCSSHAYRTVYGKFITPDLP